MIIQSLLLFSLLSAALLSAFFPHLAWAIWSSLCSLFLSGLGAPGGPSERIAESRPRREQSRTSAESRERREQSRTRAERAEKDGF